MGHDAEGRGKGRLPDVAHRLALGVVGALCALALTPPPAFASEAHAAKAEPDRPGAGFLVVAGQSKSAPYVLTGRVRTHNEKTVDGKPITVVSMRLDEPVDYTYDYKGIVSATAREVELETSLAKGYGKWKAYDGKRIMVECEGLHEAIHDASTHGVDALATGKISFIGSKGSK